MRRLLIPFFLLLFFSATAQSRIGIRGGLNAASMTFGSFKPEKRPVTRINIGTQIEIPFDENWALLTGPYYSGKGVIYARSPSTNRVDSITIRLNYIELPINIGYKFPAEKENRFAIAAGPYISYGFNGKIITRGSPRPPTTHLHKKETDQFKRLELGFNFTSLYEIKDRYGVRVDLSKSLFTIHRADKNKNIVAGFSFFWYLKKKRDIEK